MYGLPWLPGDLQAAFLSGCPVTSLIERKREFGATPPMRFGLEVDIWAVYHPDTGVYTLTKNRIGQGGGIQLNVAQATEFLLYTVQRKV
jgi:hypothetical protein